MSIKVNTIINKHYYKLIKKETIEPIVLRIINDSKIIKGNYIYVEKQDNSESDFVEISNSNNKRHIDLKIVYSQDICYEITRNNYDRWISTIKVMLNEVYNCAMDSDVISKSMLYQEFIRELEKAKDNEDIILFFPFECRIKLMNAISSFVTQDNIELIFNEIKKNRADLFVNRRVYFLSLNIDNSIVLEDFSCKRQIFEIMDDKYFMDYLEREIIDFIPN